MSKNKNGDEKAKSGNGEAERPALFVVTLCYEPAAEQISITPVGNMSAEVLREMLHRAEMQVVSFIAIENARQAVRAETAKVE